MAFLMLGWLLVVGAAIFCGYQSFLILRIISAFGADVGAIVLCVLMALIAIALGYAGIVYAPFSVSAVL